MSELERTQKFAATTIQSLGIRTHDEIARGLLGWYPLESIISLKKLSYFERIFHQNTKFIPRRILLIRLFTYILERQNTQKNSKGYIPCLLRNSKTYGLHNYVHEYVKAGDIPMKIQWAAICKRAIKEVEDKKWQANMSAKCDCPLAQLSIRGTKPHLLHCISKNNPVIRAQCLTAIKLMTVPSCEEEFSCRLCGNPVRHAPLHIVIECSVLVMQRKSLWEGITDTLDVQHTVNLLQLDDMSALAVMLGGYWDVYKDIERNTYIKFTAEAVTHISGMIHAYGGISKVL